MKKHKKVYTSRRLHLYMYIERFRLTCGLLVQLPINGSDQTSSEVFH